MTWGSIIAIIVSMTMHLQRGLSTLSTRKYKTKLTKSKLSTYEVAWRDHNKFLKSIHCATITFEQYIDYRLGRVKAKTTTGKYELPVTYSRETQSIPSLSIVSSPDSCGKRENRKYTGTLVRGIATMHKSNAVPVIDEEQMKDISRMRRG